MQTIGTTMSSNILNNRIPNEDIPVLLTIFNRPDKTRAVIDNLRQIKPKRLFVVADGPRPDHPQDVEKCRLARQEATNVDWDCDLETRFHDGNIGCDTAVASAIDWFFQNVEYGIILEDDGVPQPHFFAFCGELFDRYSQDNRIMQISAVSPFNSRTYQYDYHFSHVFRCAGTWGTWRRAWLHFTRDMSRYGDDEAFTILKSYHSDHAVIRQQFKKFLAFKKGAFDNWDFQWNMACFAQNGLCIVPEKNLMLNIGFDEEGTHTRRMEPTYDGLEPQPIRFPLRHPPFVYADGEPEKNLEKKIYRSLSLKSRCMYLLRRVLGTTSYLRDVMPYG